LPISEIARVLGISRNTVKAALASDGPPKYQRAPAGSVVDEAEPRIRELLAIYPRMPATVIAERIGWAYSIRTLSERVRELRPVNLPPDPASRTTYVAGEIAQCDFWFHCRDHPDVNGQLVSHDGDGKRKHLRKRYAAEKEACAALDAVRGEVSRGTYVHPTNITLAEACENWLAAKHGLKPSTLHGHRVNLAAAISELGDIEVQKLTKRNIDDLVIKLRVGGLPHRQARYANLGRRDRSTTCLGCSPPF
jgi:hypothetical protein